MNNREGNVLLFAVLCFWAIILGFAYYALTHNPAFGAERATPIASTTWEAGHDNLCNAQSNAESPLAATTCATSANEWHSIAAKHPGQEFTHYRMMEAFCHVQSAEAYRQAGDDANGRAQAFIGFAIFATIIADPHADPSITYFAKDGSDAALKLYPDLANPH